MDFLISNLIELISTWKRWKTASEPGPSPDVIKQKLQKYESGILGIAVQAAVDKGIISFCPRQFPGQLRPQNQETRPHGVPRSRAPPATIRVPGKCPGAGESH